jgi:CubicO group peptidase (beta-lactamase class C family)
LTFCSEPDYFFDKKYFIIEGGYMSLKLDSITADSAGINKPALDDFVHALEGASATMRGFVLLRHGKAVLRHFWTPYCEDDPIWVYSLSKSFCSTAVGFAIQEGLLKLDDLVLSFFPEYAPKVKDENCKIVKVQDLLTMRSGHEVDPTMPMVRTPDWVEYFLTIPYKYKPGTHFVYNSGATYMLSAIVQKLTGLTVLEYLKPRLFAALGFGECAWDASPQGISTGGWGFMVALEDIAKLGLFYLNKGKWEGRQLLSSAWVEDASSAHADNSITPGASADWVKGYGYQFWRGQHGFRGDGAFGQYCLVLPEFDAVLALSSETDNMQAILDIVWDKLLPAFNTSNGETEKRINSKILKVNENPAGISSIGINFYPDRLSFGFQTKNGLEQFEAGRYNWLDSSVRFPWGAFSFIPVAGMAADARKVSSAFLWKDKNELEIRMVYRNCPHRELLDIKIEGNTLKFSWPGNPAAVAIGRAELNLDSTVDF